MAKFYDFLNDDLKTFITKQHIFFVATACRDGRINLSPKGMNTFRCLSDRKVGYLDLTGSGNETSGHLRRDGRATIMFCSFDEEAKILRLYCRGRTITPQHTEWEQLIAYFDPQPGQRQIILLEIDSLQTSCGFSIPRMEYLNDRTMLIDWAEKKGTAGIAEYWRTRNTKTIDGFDTELTD